MVAGLGGRLSAAHNDPGAQPDHRSETDGYRWLRWSLLAAPVLVYLAWAWTRRWMADDGLIYLRVVRQVLAGHGPVFNSGERVEATTGPLWTSILAVGDIVTPVRLEWIAVGLGIALAAAGLLLAMLGARRLLDVAHRELTIPAGVAVLIALPPMWTFASSGLETGLSFAWLGASCFVLGGWARRGRRLHPAEAVLLGLGPLIRPDLGLFTVAFLAVSVIGGRSWRDRLVPLGWALAVPLLYQAFRMGFYGSLVPNSAIAKEASRSRWDVGWDYVRASFDPYWVWIPLVVLGIGAYLPLVSTLRARRDTRALLVVGAFATAAVLYGVYIVRVGGDFMHARLVLPGVFAFAAPVAVLPWQRRYAASLLLLPWVMASMFVLRSSADKYVDFATGKKNPVTIDDFKGWEEGGAYRKTYERGGLFYSNMRLPTSPASGRRTEIASFGIGIVSYALGPDVYVLDLLGLGDAFTAHLELERRGIPAHEKLLPAPWVVARLVKPGADLDESDFQLPNPFGGAPPEVEEHSRTWFDDRVRFARMALACGGLRDFQRTQTGPLTIGRFLGNIVDSVHGTTLRIPPDPRDAYRRFCSP